MISYTGGPIDYACFLSGDEVLLEQEATSTCGYKWEPDETNSMARNKPLETFLQEHWIQYIPLFL